MTTTGKGPAGPGGGSSAPVDETIDGADEAVGGAAIGTALEEGPPPGERTDGDTHPSSPVGPTVIDPAAPTRTPEERLTNDQLIAEHAKTVVGWPDARFLYWDSFLGASYREKGRFAEALAEYERAQQAAGDMPLFGYAVTLARAGKTADARAMLARLQAYGRDHYVNPITFAAVYTALGDRDQAFAWLDRTVADRTGWLWGIATWPEFDALRQDPRLGQLIKRIGLPTAAKAPR